MIDHPLFEKKLHDPIELADAADKITIAIDTFCPNVNAIVVSGYSGAVMGGIVSAFSHIPLVIVRKEDDYQSSHSGRRVQGKDFCGNYIIVDDLISSGSTIDRIVNAIDNDSENSHCTGIFLYEQGWLTSVVISDYIDGRTVRTYNGIPLYMIFGDYQNVVIDKNSKATLE